MSEQFLRQDAAKSREQLLQEVAMLRQRVARLEAMRFQCRSSIIELEGCLEREQVVRAEVDAMKLALNQDDRVLQTAYQQITTVLESISDAFVSLNTDWRYTYVNSHAEKILGKSRSDLMNQVVWNVFPEMVNMQGYRLAHQAMAEQTPITYEEFSPALNKWFSVRLYPSPQGLSIYFLDISDRKRMEQSLKINRQRLDFVLRTSDVGVWFCDMPFSKLEWDDKCKEHFGLAPGVEVTIDLFFERLHPDDREGTQRAMQRAIQEHSTYDVIHRTIAPDGQIRWIRAIGTVSYDDANEPIRFDGITVNVTDQKQQEEERDRLLYREQIARHLAELNIRRVSQLQELTAALAQVMTKADGIKVLLERGLAALDARRGWVAERSPDTTNRVEMVGVLGYQEDEIALSERIPLTESLPVTDAIRTGQMIIVRSPQDYRERYPTLAERFILTGTQSLVAVPLMVDDHPIGAVGLSFPIPRDFSQEDCAFLLTLAQQCAQALERARLYEAEREAREAAEAASRFKDDFLAILSHELRSPLNPILGWSRLLQLRKFDELTAKRALQTIERNARLQAQLIEDLLDVSRILQGQLNLNISSVDLVKMIETSMESARLAADAKSIDLCFAIEDSDLKNADRTTNSLELVNTDSSKLTTQSSKFQVAGDATRIQQIMWNLVSNAVKFTQPGGQVAIKLSLVSGHSSDAEETNGTQEKGKPDHYARIQVSDTGKGIHSDFLPYVFDSFRQADSTITRRFGGLGMGLAIVRHLVELHGGLVQAESLGEGRGSTFTVWLPLLKDEGVRMKGEWEPQSSTFSSLPLKGIRVLVVDDESDIRDFAAFVLEQFGAEPIVVASAAEALQALAKFQFDILLSDIGMPKVDGYGLMCQIRKLPADRGGKIPAIALTAYAGEFNQRKALSSGFQLHMSKPVEPEALIAAISRLVRK